MLFNYATGLIVQ